MTVMLYRPADAPNPEVWGRLVEHRIFDEAEVAAALNEGWVNHPDELLTNQAAEPDPSAPAPKRKGRPPKEA